MAPLLNTVLPWSVRWKLDGFTFNAADKDGREWIITDDDGWSGSPSPQTKREPRVGHHGSFRGRAYRSERVITLEGLCAAPTPELRRQAEDALAAICSDPGVTYPLTCTEETGEKTCNVELDDQVQTDRLTDTTFTFSLQFAAPDPRRYQPWTKAETPLPKIGQGGIRANPHIRSTPPGIHSGSWETKGIATVANTGSAPTWPVFEIRGPCPKPTITVGQTAQWLEYEADIPDGRSLWINTGYAPALGLPGRAVLLDRVVSRHEYLTMHGPWPQIPERTSWDLHFKAPVPSPESPPPAARLIVHYRPAWW